MYQTIFASDDLSGPIFLSYLCKSNKGIGDKVLTNTFGLDRNGQVNDRNKSIMLQHYREWLVYILTHLTYERWKAFIGHCPWYMYITNVTQNNTGMYTKEGSH